MQLARLFLRKVHGDFAKPMRSSLLSSHSRLIRLSGSNGIGNRFYSIQPTSSTTPRLPELDPSKLEITQTTTPKELTPPKELAFGKKFTGIVIPQRDSLISN